MSRVEFGYVDFVSRSYQEGRLTFFRTSAGRGRAFITIPGVREKIWQPPGFARACDQIADARQLIQAFMWNELSMRGIVMDGRHWRVESEGGVELAAGTVLDVFDAPHEVVHGLTVAVATVANPSVTVDSDVKTKKYENVIAGSTVAKGFHVVSVFPTGPAVDRGKPLPPS